MYRKIVKLAKKCYYVYEKRAMREHDSLTAAPLKRRWTRFKN